MASKKVGKRVKKAKVRTAAQRSRAAKLSWARRRAAAQMTSALGEAPVYNEPPPDRAPTVLGAAKLLSGELTHSERMELIRYLTAFGS